MSKFTYVYIRDPESNACCTACIEHIKTDNRTDLKLAFSFASPVEQQFERKISRDIATSRMLAGEYITVEKRRGHNTYYTVKEYLRWAMRQIDSDDSTVEKLLKIKPYKVGKRPSLTSEFWAWMFSFVERL